MNHECRQGQRKILSNSRSNQQQQLPFRIRPSLLPAVELRRCGRGCRGHYHSGLSPQLASPTLGAPPRNS